MTDQQLDLTWAELCDWGAEQFHAPADLPPIDLRGQGLTAVQTARIEDVEITGEWL
jgi:hypothetical protein